MGQALIKIIFSMLVRIFTFPIRILPVKRNQILFTGLTGGRVYDYSCNPRYIYEYLREQFPGQFAYVWAVSDIDKYVFLKEEGVRLVRHFTVSSFAVLLTSKVIVTNGSYAPWFPFRKKQYVINTWHGGGAYKQVENGRPDTNWATRKRAEFCANNIDLFLASCRMQEEKMIRETYGYKGEVLKAGTPRNDKLVRGEIKEMAEKVRNRYAIPENGRIVLYAPTYRKSRHPVKMDSDYLLQQLEQMGSLPGGKNDEGKGKPEWFFFCRYHRYQDEDDGIRVTGEHVIDVADYPDMQELLCAADMLITDYSSCIWDYGFLARPCFLYVPDKEEYTAKTGFYTDLGQWPFDQAKSMETLAENIRNYDAELAVERIAAHFEKLGSYEKGNCCRVVAGRIVEVTGIGEKRDEGEY